MRISLALWLLTLPPLAVAAQAGPNVTVSLGMATAWGGSGPSGAVRLELPLHELSERVALVWGGTGWLARTSVPESLYDIKRDAGGIGSLLALQWRPGGSDWRLTLGGGIEYIWNRNQNPTIPVSASVQEHEMPIPEHSKHFARDTGPGAVLAARLALPPQAGATIEVGANATRHALFDEGAWWSRFEVGVRLGGGRR